MADAAEDLLAAVLAHPEDDAPRLAYADWLDRHGDPDRAAFLRVQIARTRFAPDDPADDELERRDHLLLNRHPEWIAEAGSPWHRQFPIFRRGYLDDVHCEAGELVSRVEPLARRTPLRGLRVSVAPDDPLPDPGRLAFLPRLRRLCVTGEGGPGGLAPPGFWDACANLRDLGLDAGALSVADVDALLASGLPGRLTRLDLYFGFASPDVFCRLLGCPALFSVLGELSLNRNDLPPELLDELARLDMPALRSFGLCGWSLSGTAPPGFLAAMLDPARRPRLEGLGLGSCDLAGDGMAALATAPGLARLASLGLSFNRLEQADIDPLLAGPNAPRLRWLDLSGNCLDPDGLVALAAYPSLADLRRLGLHRARSNPAAVRALAGSPHLRGLRQLDLGYNGLGEDGVRALVGHATWPLAELHLQHNDLGDEGARVLAEEGTFALPVRLHLGWNNIGERGVAALAASPRAGRLGQLTILHNPLGDAGLAALAASPHLDGLWRLDVAETGAGPAAQMALRQRFGRGLEGVAPV